MPFLYDTNVTSELRRAKNPACDAQFASWAASADLAQAHVCVITLHEMMRGVMLTERKDASKGLVYRAWFETLLDAFDGRILDVTLDAAIFASRCHIPDPAPLADALIAGVAASKGLTIVTRNTDDFARFGVPLLNPWITQP